MKWNEVHPKVGAGALGGALAGVLTWVLDAFVGVEVPPEVAAAFATILSFIGGYLKSS